MATVLVPPRSGSSFVQSRRRPSCPCLQPYEFLCLIFPCRCLFARGAALSIQITSPTSRDRLCAAHLQTITSPDRQCPLERFSASARELGQRPWTAHELVLEGRPSRWSSWSSPRSCCNDPASIDPSSMNEGGRAIVPIPAGLVRGRQSSGRDEGTTRLSVLRPCTMSSSASVRQDLGDANEAASSQSITTPG